MEYYAITVFSCFVSYSFFTSSDNASGQDLDAARGPPLNGSSFSEKNGFKFQMQVVRRRKKTFFSSAIK